MWAIHYSGADDEDFLREIGPLKKAYYVSQGSSRVQMTAGQMQNRRYDETFP